MARTRSGAARKEAITVPKTITNNSKNNTKKTAGTKRKRGSEVELLSLPNELLLKIIEELPLGDTGLKSLRQSCSRLKDLATPWMFRVLKLPRNLEQLKRASSIVTKEHLARHVRTIYIRGEGLLPEAKMRLGYDDHLEVLMGAEGDKTILAIWISNFTLSVYRILEACRNTLRSFDVKGLSSALYPSFVKLADEIFLCGVMEAMSVCDLPALKSLRLEFLDVANLNDAWEIFDPRPQDILSRNFRRPKEFRVCAMHESMLPNVSQTYMKYVLTKITNPEVETLGIRYARMDQGHMAAHYIGEKTRLTRLKLRNVTFADSFSRAIANLGRLESVDLVNVALFQNQDRWASVIRALAGLGIDGGTDGSIRIRDVGYNDVQTHFEDGFCSPFAEDMDEYARLSQGKKDWVWGVCGHKSHEEQVDGEEEEEEDL